MTFLWDKKINKDSKWYILIKKLLEKSKHNVSDNRIYWLVAWIDNKQYLLDFIITNINICTFYAFANPWDGNIEDIFYNRATTKLIRLSTRCVGHLTISTILGLANSQRIIIDTNGKILFGSFKFETINELYNHINGTCCICLDDISKEISTKFSCGHLFHTKCLESYKNINNKCPLCRATILNNEIKKIPGGTISVYEII